MSIEIRQPRYLELFTSSYDELQRRIFITGASGSGKSALWKILRRKLAENVDFPVRLISRPNRKDDDLSENKHLPIEEFEPRFHKKSIEFFWPKFLPERTEYYGFEFSKNKTVIYGCNNEFLLNGEHIKSHSDLFGKGLIIHVTCSFEVRKRRLIERYNSQKISSEEIKYRIESSEGEEGLTSRCQIIIQNDSIELSELANNLINLLALN